MKDTTIKNEQLFCNNCGGSFNLNMPCEITVMAEKIKSFDELHKDCKKTYVPPIVDMNIDVRSRALWWSLNGQKGMSSETMFGLFMGVKDFRINHPHDPDDFSRCYKLLEIVPEWKQELHKLKSLSPAWSNLVDNWDELTIMYEQNVKEDWKNSKEIGMYHLMQKLVN